MLQLIDTRNRSPLRAIEPSDPYKDISDWHRGSRLVDAKCEYLTIRKQVRQCVGQSGNNQCTTIVHSTHSFIHANPHVARGSVCPYSFGFGALSVEEWSGGMAFELFYDVSRRDGARNGIEWLLPRWWFVHCLPQRTGCPLTHSLTHLACATRAVPRGPINKFTGGHLGPSHGRTVTVDDRSVTGRRLGQVQ